MQTMWAEHSLKEVPMDTQQEFQQFYQENLGLIYRYVYNQVGNRDEAEDLTSQIFLKVVSNIDHERSRLSMKKWLYLIARSMIADHWRAHYRLPMSSLDELVDIGWEVPAEKSRPQQATARQTRCSVFFRRCLNGIGRC